MAEKDFVVNKVGWFTKQKGYETLVEENRSMFRAYFEFLQRHGLVRRTILASGQPVTDELELRWSDLTDRGKLLVKRYENKWLAKFDRRNVPPDDVEILERGLAKIDKEISASRAKEV